MSTVEISKNKNIYWVEPFSFLQCDYKLLFFVVPMQIADVILSWPCHTFLVDSSYNFDLLANVAGPG